LSFDGEKYGWAIRYRKSGKTLVTLYPERGSFMALVVLGKPELVKAKALAARLSKRVQAVLKDATQLRDGRWLWIRPASKADIDSIRVLLGVKRRPKPTAASSSKRSC
jgi:hypothetical protein